MRTRDDLQRWDQLHIQLLDRFEIVHGERSVDAALQKTRKGRTLICMLILHRGQPVPHEILQEAIWGPGDTRDLDNVLKVLVSRTRAILAEVHPALRDCILGQKGTYRWNMDMTREIDSLEVETLCKELAAQAAVTEDYQVKLETLLCMYTGRLLPEEAQSEWIARQAEAMENRFRETVSNAIRMLKASQNWKAVMKVCRMALLRLPKEAGWHDEMMNALLMLGECERPSTEVVKLYSDIRAADGAMDREIDAIGDDLLACQDRIEGVQVCDYATFKNVYEQQLRSADRSGAIYVVALLRVGSVREESPEAPVLDMAMDRLVNVLKDSLRKGDTITRYASSQYAVLLENPAAGSVKRIFERIRMAFYREINNVEILLDYRYRPLITNKEALRMKAL